MADADIRRLSPGDLSAAEGSGCRAGGRHQARLGEVIDVLAFDGDAAWDGDRLVGIATCAHGGDRRGWQRWPWPPTDSAAASVADWSTSPSRPPERGEPVSSGW